MRKAIYLLCVLFAMPASSARADGSTLDCERESKVLWCKVPVTVVAPKPDEACTATVPRYVKVPRRIDQRWIVLVFSLNGGGPKVKFDDYDGIKFEPKGKKGTDSDTHFGRPSHLGKVATVLNKNPSGDEEFEYAIKVMNGTKECDPADPFIHNTN